MTYFVHVQQKSPVHGIARLYDHEPEIASDGLPRAKFIWSSFYTITDEGDCLIEGAMEAPPVGALPAFQERARRIGAIAIVFDRMGRDGVIRKKRFPV